MNKIHSFFVIFIGSFSVLCFLVVLTLFYNIQSNQVKSLALEAMTALAEWNRVENASNDILINRFMQFGTESSPVISKWKQEYTNFEENLENLMENPQIERQKQIQLRLEGAYRVWRFTEVRLNNAEHYLNQIIKTGLGERVMVNGMLQTMYQMRMEGQLSTDEICLLEDTIYALESLDNATDEFDQLFNSIVYDMNTEGEIYLQRIKALLVALFISVVLVLITSLLINRQLKNAQENKKIYLENRKSRLLRALCENSSEEELIAFRKKQIEYEITISIDNPIFIIMLQIDNFQSFSHKYNIEEQQEQIRRISEVFTSVFSEMHHPSESFRYDDDVVVFMLNAEPSDDLSLLKRKLRACQEKIDSKELPTVSITLSDICFENEDLDRDFQYLQRLSEYRYLIGTNSFIFPGASKLRPDEFFKYPLEKERQFEEAFKSLDKEATIEFMKEMIEYAEPYGPESVKRLILRLTAAQTSVVELLEKSYHLSVLEGVTPVILAIQKVETLEQADLMLQGIVINVIEACQQKKTEKHDQTVIMIKEIIENELSDFNLSADNIADRFNLTTSYINRLFKQHTTLSIAGYINERRLMNSEELLRTTDKTVAQIAELSGFSSMGTFFRLFKKRNGRTPGELAADLGREVKS